MLANEQIHGIAMSSPLGSVLAARVRQERLRLGWTQSDAAARAGVSKRSYQRFERSGMCTLARVDRVLASLGLSVVVVAATGETPPAPDSRLTRQRGLRHAHPVTPPKPPPPRPGPEPPVPPVDPGRIAVVAKEQRDRIIMLVRTIVSNGLTNYTSYQVVQNTMNVAKDLDEADRPAFVAAVVSQLNGLNSENLAAYGIGPSEFEHWRQGWNPDLGIVDVLAGTADARRF